VLGWLLILLLGLVSTHILYGACLCSGWGVAWGFWKCRARLGTKFLAMFGAWDCVNVRSSWLVLTGHGVIIRAVGVHIMLLFGRLFWSCSGVWRVLHCEHISRSFCTACMSVCRAARC